MDLPHTPGRVALRAALMALRVPPLALPADAAGRCRLLAGLSNGATSGAASVAFIDISHRADKPATGLLDLFEQAPSGDGRARIALTRLAEGHVSAADRQWVKDLGFADLFAEFEPLDAEGSLRQAVDWAARTMGLPTLPAAELARYVRASGQAAPSGDARALIRLRTGLSAEQLTSRLASTLAIENRRWRMTTYARCFVGQDAVARIAGIWQCSKAEAVELGQALMRLGLLVHVVQEHPFLDDSLFYRLAWTEKAPTVGLGTLWETLSFPGGVEATTRHYLGKAYPDCWIGRNAVDRLCAQHGLDRLEAWLALHRLMQFGLFEHVTRARPFIDGEFFYRFAPTGAPAAR